MSHPAADVVSTPPGRHHQHPPIGSDGDRQRCVAIHPLSGPIARGPRSTIADGGEE